MRTHSLMSALWGFSAAVALAAGPGCGSGDLGVLLSLSNVPSSSKTLQVAAQLDQQMLTTTSDTSLPLPLKDNQLGVTVPRAGHLALDLRALDSDGCLLASARPELDVSSRRTDLAVPLSGQTPRRCGELPTCTTTNTTCTLTIPANSTITPSIRSIWALSGSDIWAVGTNATVLHYDGKAWTATPTGNLPVPSTTILKGVWGSGPSDVWAVGSAGKILHYDGTTWTASSSGASHDLEAISGISKDHVWTVGRAASTTTKAEFWHWGGSQWSQINPPGQGDLYAVAAIDANFVVGGGGNGTTPTLWIWDGVNTFQIFSASAVVPVWGLWGRSRTRVIGVGPTAQVLVFEGATWKLTDIGYGTYDFYTVGSDGTTTLIVGTNGLLLQTTDAALKSVTRISTGLSTGSTVYAASVAKNGLGWLGGDKGFLGYYDTRP